MVPKCKPFLPLHNVVVIACFPQEFDKVELIKSEFLGVMMIFKDFNCDLFPSFVIDAFEDLAEAA